MSNLTTHRCRKLLAQTNCPACGAGIENKAGEISPPHAIVQYLCSAEFLVDCNAAIIASQPCPAAGHVAARHLNEEAAHEAAEAGAA